MSSISFKRAIRWQILAIQNRCLTFKINRLIRALKWVLEINSKPTVEICLILIKISRLVIQKMSFYKIHRIWIIRPFSAIKIITEAFCNPSNQLPILFKIKLNKIKVTIISRDSHQWIQEESYIFNSKLNKCLVVRHHRLRPSLFLYMHRILIWMCLGAQLWISGSIRWIICNSFMNRICKVIVDWRHWIC